MPKARWTVEIDCTARSGGGLRRFQYPTKEAAQRAMGYAMGRNADDIYLISLYDVTGLRKAVWREGGAYNDTLVADSNGRLAVLGESWAQIDVNEGGPTE